MNRNWKLETGHWKLATGNWQLIAVCAALLAVAGCSRGAEHASATSAHASAPAESSSWRLPHSVVPEHYALTVAPDLATATFTGDESIDVRVVEATPRIVVNSAEIAVQSATVEAGGSVQDAQVAFDEKTELATFTVPRAVAAGPARMHIKYTGHLNDQLRGFYLSKANNRRYAVTQLEATDARRMFPGFDEPAMKATFDLTAVIDTNDHAISNGTVVSDTPGPAAGKHTIVFSTTPKMSTYLLALVVGDFQCTSGAADGIPIRVCATPDKAGLTSVALASAQNVMQYYDRYFSIKYPYKKLDIVAVPDFSAGAMENTAAIFYRETDLLVDPKAMSVASAKNVYSVLAHEMAHQWFGDLVTMAWWDDIWLNEGFATWMANKPMKAARPDWHVELGQVQESLQAMSVDALASTRPVHAPADTPAAINESFDAMAYQKGGSILRMVEAFVGEEPFRKGINAYLEKFQYANATGQDFWNVITQSTGKPVDKVMASFVSQPGVPIVSLTSHCDGTELKVDVAQQRYRLPEQRVAETTWQIPVCIQTRNGDQGGAMCDLLAEQHHTYPFGSCSEGTILIANASAAGYFRSAYTPELLNRALSQIRVVKEEERMMLASDAWALVRSGTNDVGVPLEVAQALASDQTSSVMQTVGASLGNIDDSIAVDATAAPYRAWVVRTFKPALDRVGWTRTPGEPDDRAELRAALIGIVAGIGHDPDARARAHALVLRYLDNPASVDATTLERAIGIAAEEGDAALYDRIRAKWEASRAPEERDRLLYTLGRFTDPQLVQRTFDLAMSDKVRVQDTSILLGVALGGPAGPKTMWPLVRDRWSDVAKHIDPFTGPAYLAGSMSGFCDDALATDVEQFFKKHPAESAERTARQTIERTRSCAALQRAQQPKLAAWLSAHAQ